MKNLLFFLPLMLLVACNSKTKIPNSPTNIPTTYSDTEEPVNDPMDDVSDLPAFTMIQETCRGHCPGFNYTIFQSGKVDYFGQRNVDRIGNHIATMSKAQLKTLKAMEKKIGFQKMEDEYADWNVMDLPSTTVTCGDKKIKYQAFKAPEELEGFVKMLNESLETLKWEKVD